MTLLKELYQYRELLKTNVRKEIRGKYKGSFLGVLWSFINPLLQVLVYAIIFPYIMRMKIDHYLIYLVVGIIPWNFFVTVINQGMITVRMNAGIIKKVYFPREILPISVALSGLVNFLISCIVIVVFCLFDTSVGLSWHIIFLPVLALLQFMMVLGITLALSAINIYIKDTEYLIQFFINLLFYATPILYLREIFPQSLQWILSINPMTSIIDAYRSIFLYHQLPGMVNIIYIVCISLFFIATGLLIFKKLEKGFAEEV